MPVSQPLKPTPEDLGRLVSLAESSHPYLSVYLTTDPSSTTTEAVRLKLASLLDGVALEGTGAIDRKAFQQERQAVEEYIRHLRPGGKGLAILSSKAAGEWHAVWLPDRVEPHAAFGHGAYVLPLIDVLDELEPVCVVVLERDSARMLLCSAGVVAEKKGVQSDVPRRHKSAGRESGGRGAPSFEARIAEQERAHLAAALQELEALQANTGFQRIVLAGAVDARGHFKKLISKRLGSMVVGEMPVDARASDQDIAKKASDLVRAAEREHEEVLVEEVVTRARKSQGAVVGVDPTVWALNRGEMHLLVLTGAKGPDSQYCQPCDYMLPLASLVCPQCQGKPTRVHLWEELPGFAMRRGVEMEVVHGKAASALREHDGVGGLLKPPTR
ncbi:MAG: hypothetical protein FJ317_02470 [SAR202 cluster bacterium]|nr:hypothetical protein [SAR202 cluster bacterium]